MADELFTVAVVLTALVLVAFAWMAASTRSLSRRGEQRAKELRERTMGLEKRAAALEHGVRELKATSEKKADHGYVEKRINGLIALVKGHD